ncbi:hypothetical protein AV530_009267 [Patagioenas fasciata monilis]|uniref:Uncharacterized protein n=1 Tax=Patagioenas fasciata monilis TaxID=372326 RepID=A0A1V4JIB5_PATFA|nr:hypothetical protein AV530_009267 [Patagioenas fasciata monilis]
MHHPVHYSVCQLMRKRLGGGWIQKHRLKLNRKSSAGLGSHTTRVSEHTFLMERHRTAIILQGCGSALKLCSIFGALLERFQDHHDTITSLWVGSCHVLTSSLGLLNTHTEESKQTLCFLEQMPFTRWSLEISQGK